MSQCHREKRSDAANASIARVGPEIAPVSSRKFTVTMAADRRMRPDRKAFQGRKKNEIPTSARHCIRSVSD